MESGASTSSKDLTKASSKAMKKVLKDVANLMQDSTSNEQKIETLRAIIHKQTVEIQKTEGLQLQLDTTIRDRDKMKSDLIKSQQSCHRLEEICRALQTQKIEIEAASKRRSEEDHERMLKAQENLNQAIQGIQLKIDASSAERMKTAEENQELHKRLGETMKVFSSFEELLAAKDDALKKGEALQRDVLLQREALLEKTDIIVQSNENLTKEVSSSHEHISLLTQLNDGLKIQLKQQQESYKKLDSAVASVKKEISSSTKKNVESTKRLARSENLNLSLSEENLALKADISKLTSQKEKLESQKEKLESLCRELTKRNAGTRDP